RTVRNRDKGISREQIETGSSSLCLYSGRSQLLSVLAFALSRETRRRPAANQEIPENKKPSASRSSGRASRPEKMPARYRRQSRKNRYPERWRAYVEENNR